MKEEEKEEVCDPEGFGLYDPKGFYHSEGIYNEFSFCLLSDEQLNDSIQDSIADINYRIATREFEGIEQLGQTLIELEKEKSFRNNSKH